jgi:hypothetical protein
MEDVGIFMSKWCILWPNGIFYGHLVHFVVIWYIIFSCGMLYREKSGNLDNDETQNNVYT